MDNPEGGGAGAGGGGAGAGGGGGDGGEGDVPDVRFLWKSKKVNVGNRSEDWKNNNLNSPLNTDITVEEKEHIFVNLLESLGFAKEETKIRYRVPDRLNRQGHQINALNAHACVLIGAMGRKRRRCLFLMVMLFGLAQGLKSFKCSNVQVPQQFCNPAQLRGDLKSCQDGIELIAAQLQNVIQQIEDLRYEAVMIPDVFGKPLELPKSMAKKK